MRFRDSVLGRLREAGLERISAALAPRYGLTPIDQIVPEDVVIAGYPKSGNTWFQNMVLGALYGIETHQLPDAIVQDLVPDFQHRKFYRRYQTPTYFKSHHLPQPEYRRIVYLLRDGRDVMVSYLHHRRALEGEHVSLVDMVERAEGLFPGPWHEHVRSYMTNPYGAELIVVKYEDMKADTLRELRRFCEFAGLDRSDDELRRVVADASFERMKQKERVMGWEKGVWPKDKSFIRRGVVGSHRDEMTGDVLERFVAMARPELERFGYIAPV